MSAAPVAHAGALVPGIMPIFAAALSGVFLGERLGKRRLICFTLILLASATIILKNAGTHGPGDASVGHALFLLGAFCWACFTVTAKTLKISPYLATAIVGSISSTMVLPVWVFSDLSNIGSVGIGDIVFQTIFQGILSGLVSLFAFTQAIRMLGMRASVFSALVPGIATLLAVPVLGQVPDQVEISALLFVVMGLGIGAFERSTAQFKPRPSRLSQSQSKTIVQKLQKTEAL